MPGVVALALMFSIQAGSGVEALMRQAREASPDLVESVRAGPDHMREALRRLHVAAASGEEADFESARRLALAYARAFADSFFVRQVALFRSFAPDQRRDRLVADSLRLEGNRLFGTGGTDAAGRAWRESAARCGALADTACLAAAFGNLGAAFYAESRLDSAAWYFDQARALATIVGDVRTLGNAVGALANIRRDHHDPQGAAELYAEAAALRVRSGDRRGEAADRNNIGLMAQQLGDVEAARAGFEAALGLNRAARRMDAVALNLLNLGNLSAQEGRFSQSAAHYYEAFAIYRDRADDAGTAAVLHGLGEVHLRRGEFAVALTSFREAEGIYRRIGPSSELIRVHRSLANARAAMGDLPGALQELARAGRAAIGRAQARGALSLGRADLMMQFNRPAEAERYYRAAVLQARRAGDRATVLDARQGLAVLLMLRERWAEAAQVLSGLTDQVSGTDAHTAATSRLLLAHAQRRSGDSSGARRMLLEVIEAQRLMNNVAGESAAWAELGELELDAASARAAQAMFERGLSRLAHRRVPAVAWRLRLGLGKAFRQQGDFDGAAAQLQTAIAAVDSVASGLGALGSADDYLTDKWTVYAELSGLEVARGRPAAAFAVSERLRARQLGLLTGSAGDTVFTGVDTAAIVRSLDADQALLEYLVADSAVIAFVVTRRGIAALELDLNRSTLAALAGLTRAAMVRPGTGSARSWRPALARLYDELMAPLEAAGLLAGVRALTIVPHLELHYLPFAALLRRGTSEQFLVERYEIGYAVSAAGWHALSQRAAPLGRGLLALAPYPSRLPGTAAEVTAVRRTFGPEVTVLRGGRASESALRSLIGNSRIVHLATNGVLNRRNPLFSFVELAGGNGQDGRLEVREILELSIGARLVVLSACQTSLASGRLSDVPTGDDWVGLVQAFLQAGAANVFGSLWTVDDAATATLMEVLYRELAEGRSERRAAAEAQRRLLRNALTAHPFYWAGFTLVGRS